MESKKIIRIPIPEMDTKEYNKCIKFLDRDDSDDARFIMWLAKDRDMKNAEVIVLFENEFFYKTRGQEDTSVHNEALNMDSDFSFEKDFSISLRKQDISSMSVYRPSICNCNKESSAHQPDHYELEVGSSGETFQTIIHDREVVYALYNHIRDWRFGKGLFKKSLWKKIKLWFKNL